MNKEERKHMQKEVWVYNLSLKWGGKFWGLFFLGKNSCGHLVFFCFFFNWVAGLELNIQNIAKMQGNL
jgi:hypothetical protein